MGTGSSYYNDIGIRVSADYPMINMNLLTGGSWIMGAHVNGLFNNDCNPKHPLSSDFGS